MDLVTSWSALGGPLARLEAGAAVTPYLGVFGFAETSQRGPQAGAGARLTFDLFK